MTVKQAFSESTINHHFTHHLSPFGSNYRCLSMWGVLPSPLPPLLKGGPAFLVRVSNSTYHLGGGLDSLITSYIHTTCTRPPRRARFGPCFNLPRRARFGPCFINLGDHSYNPFSPRGGHHNFTTHRSVCECVTTVYYRAPRPKSTSPTGRRQILNNFL